MMFQEPSPYNGTTGNMQQIFAFTYCQANACTGMPDGADTYMYAYGHNGNRNNVILARVLKTAAYFMDPAQWSYYTASNYSPSNTGNGTSWSSTLANAALLWNSGDPANSGTVPLINYGNVWSGVSYICSGAACSLVFTAVPSGAFYSLVTAPHPWGPFTATKVNSLSGSDASVRLDYFHLLAPTTFPVADGTAYHVKVLGTWDTYLWGNHIPITSLTIGANPIASSGEPFSTGWTGSVNGTIYGATGCWAAINGTVHIISYVRAESVRRSGEYGGMHGQCEWLPLLHRRFTERIPVLADFRSDLGIGGSGYHIEWLLQYQIH